jgi:CRISPR/Cas system-associated exonuclease Cas4 (RecB family)
MLINHISVSRRKCYQTCGQQYKYRYHLKVPSPKEEPEYFAYGKLIHKIAEVYVERRGESTIGEVSQEITRGKIPIEEYNGNVTYAAPLSSTYKRKFPKHLKAIQKLTGKLGFEGVLEHAFYYDLDTPNGRHIKGFIDRLIITEGKNGELYALIIDYKTTKKGKWRVNAKTVKTDLQLRAYARVVEKEFGIKAENIKACLYYLEGENIVGTSFTSASLALVEAELKDAFIEIEAADPDKVWGNVGWWCKTCDYGPICPFYKENRPMSPKQKAWDGDLGSLGFGV